MGAVMGHYMLQNFSDKKMCGKKMNHLNSRSTISTEMFFEQFFAR